MIYVNEIDPYCAQWLQNLMDAEVLPRGHIDTRSIEDVTPNDLAGYTQHHFFAGLGGWIYALDLAGWPRDRPVWTGSCPCQPFSAAGKSSGFADERHLWPAWQHLIAQRKPATVFGEQVASKAADDWLDLVQADLEALDYALGAIPFPSASVGAPHIRDRLYWVAHAGSEGCSEQRGQRDESTRLAEAGVSGRMANADNERRKYEQDQRPASVLGTAYGETEQQRQSGDHGASAYRLADAYCDGRDQRGQRVCSARSDGLVGDHVLLEGQPPAGPTNGFWADADWLFCRDGKWRAVEASPQPLADGLPEGLGRVCAATIAEVEAEVASYAAYRKTSAAEELRNLCEALDAQAQRGWAPGGLPDLHSAAFLLAFVCQLATQGWQLTQGLPLSGPKAAGAGMRVLWDNEAAARASRQRGLEGQPARERADALHFLSPVLARHAQASWGKAYSAYAEIGFPLGHSAPGRVGRLRAYGNAINPWQAAEFVKATMESLQ